MELNENQPLFLPSGSVRALIALALVITMCVIAGVRSEIPNEILGIVGIIIGFYFGVRTVTK